MIEFTARLPVSGRINWHYSGDEDDEGKNELNISFYYYERLKRREAVAKVKDDIARNNVEWLVFGYDRWLLKSDLLRSQFPQFEEVGWLRGDVFVEPEVEPERDEVLGEEGDTTRVSFILSKEYVDMTSQNKIFLSHKGVNKPEVREYSSALEALGFRPWLDEDAMTAGTPLERGLRQGFKDSCAVIFFITTSFQDENYLATEIDYAIEEKRAKGDRFAIITLLLRDEVGRVGQVPELLKRFVWKEPKSQLEALREVLKALPVKVGPVQWKG